MILPVNLHYLRIDLTVPQKIVAGELIAHRGTPAARECTEYFKAIFLDVF